MHRAQLKQLNKKVDKIFSRKKIPIFPILGGLSTSNSTDPEPTREVTAQEANLLLSKGFPAPISIALSREMEFLEYLKNERWN